MSIDKGMPILIVDDYRTMLRIIRSLLSQIGFKNVDEAIDGSYALSRLRTKEYGLIISDWNMDPMSGLQLLKAVRADATFGEVPFIMLLGENTSDKMIAAKEAGASSYIVKPFNAATLKAKLKTVLGKEGAP